MYIHPDCKLNNESWTDKNGIYITNTNQQFIFDGTFIPCNIPCEICGNLCWKAKNGNNIHDRIWMDSRYMCRDCAKSYINKQPKPYQLETLCGESSMAAWFLLNSEDVEKLEINKIYKAEDFKLKAFWYRNNKPVVKVRCIL